MHPIFWKTLTGLLILCCLLLQFGGRVELRDIYGSDDQELQVLKHTTPTPSLTTETAPWVYRWERDRNNHGLSSGHCTAAFPDLYHEIDRAVAYWSSRNITPETTELYHENEGGVRVLITNQQLRVLQTKGMRRRDFRTRIMAVLHQLHRALQGSEAGDAPFKDVEFTVVVDDWPSLPHDREAAYWTFTRQAGNAKHDQVWLIPDFNFWSAPPSAGSFQDMQVRARRRDAPVINKRPQAVWRGVSWTNPDIRLSLINATKGESWADVQLIEWNDKSNIMELDDFCHYGYLVNTEGRSWSSRLTHILNCDSVPILHDMQWVAHYYHLLKPAENFVAVNRDFSDIGEKMQQYLQDPQSAQDIADSARHTFRERNTTPAATACYWRRLLRSWSTVAPRPQGFEEVKQGGSSDVRAIRGIAFEEFVLHNSSTDYPFE